MKRYANLLIIIIMLSIHLKNGIVFGYYNGTAKKVETEKGCEYQVFQEDNYITSFPCEAVDYIENK